MVRFDLCYTFFIASCYPVLLSVTLYYYIFFILCILKKIKGNLYKYMYIYREAEI